MGVGRSLHWNWEGDLWLYLFFYPYLSCFLTELSKRVDQKYPQIDVWVAVYKVEGVEKQTDGRIDKWLDGTRDK